MQVVMDRTSTIRASLSEVERSLLISIALVILVVFLFLRNGRATAIPAITVPVSLVGTFAVMYLCGFSLNNLSLMALTIATGFVVDDTIVVLENIARHIENGMKPFQAALQGAREVGFTVLSMSISLIAVFIPILMMGGIIGRLFREFAVTLSVAILVSLLVSLTTTPMLCARWLKPHANTAGPPVCLERAHVRRHAGRLSPQPGLGAAPRPADDADAGGHHRAECLSVRDCAQGLFPAAGHRPPDRHDQGRPEHFLPGHAAKAATLYRRGGQDPAVDKVIGFTGGGQRNTANMFVSLKPLGERTESADQVIARLRKLAREPGAQLFLQSVQDIRVGGRRPMPSTSTPCKGMTWKSCAAGRPRYSRRCKSCRCWPMSAAIRKSRACKPRSPSTVTPWRASA
jgi:multidrug efflux pump